MRSCHSCWTTPHCPSAPGKRGTFLSNRRAASATQVTAPYLMPISTANNIRRFPQVVRELRHRQAGAALPFNLIIQLNISHPCCNSLSLAQNLQVLSSAESTVPCESSSAAPINSHGASNDGPLSSSHRPDKHALDMQDSLSMQDFSELPIFESPPTSSSDESCEIGADDNVERDCPESPVTSAAIDADDTLTAENIHTTAPITAAGSSPVPPSDAPASSLCSGAQLPIPCSSYFTKGMAAEGYPLSNYLACFKILRLSFHK